MTSRSAILAPGGNSSVDVPVLMSPGLQFSAGVVVRTQSSGTSRRAGISPLSDSG